MKKADSSRREPAADYAALEKILGLLRARTGHDLSSYKKSIIYRRVERRMQLHQLAALSDYVEFLRENSQEAELLFKELLIGVTRFFRDPEVWQQLKGELTARLLADYPDDATLRAWVPGCSTGEEAYSLGMVFCEALAEVAPGRRLALQIFATDLDPDAIDKARGGVYPNSITADVTAQQLHRFFVKDERGYRVNKQLREMILFAPQNVIMDPPFTRLDILTCRNLLIYFGNELQKKLIPLFHYCLRPDGILLLGSAETVGQDTDLFAPLPGKHQLYRRLDKSLRWERIALPTIAARSRRLPEPQVAGSAPPTAPQLQSLVEQLLLKEYCPAAVLVTPEGDIVYFCGETGKYLELPAGRANLNLFVMAREGLHYGLSETFRKALLQRKTMQCKGITQGLQGNAHAVDVTVQPLTVPAALSGLVLVVFARAAATKPSARRKREDAAQDVQITTLLRELQKSGEELQACRAKMQDAEQELQVTNEELQSTNEELQVTNEELITTKEELQSMNEELQTVNYELQAKLDELSHSASDTRSLLDSTHLATLFLDSGLRVRRFTPQMAKLIALLPSDVGRLITDFAIDLHYPGAGLVEDAREVLRTLVYKELQVATHDGSWFRVRIMPCRTLENRINGLVITCTDITEIKMLEARLGRSAERLRELGVIVEEDPRGRPRQ